MKANRKNYKKKLRSCPLCKPHKTNGDIRWNAKDFNLAKAHKKEILET